MSRVIECCECGCDRKIIVRSKITNQVDNITYSYRPLCLHCFLKISGAVGLDGTEQKDVTMETMTP